jgi:prepilin peptidase CpaA
MSGFWGEPLALLGGAVFTLLLVVVCVSDLRRRRIPNRLVGTLAVAGIGYALAVMPIVSALRYALGGAAVGLGLWLPFWAMRVLGAGDVKLVAASGTWLGPLGVLEASLYGAALGGLLAVWALARTGGITRVLPRFGTWLFASRVMRRIAPETIPAEKRVPYGLALAAGAAIAGWYPGLIL